MKRVLYLSYDGMTDPLGQSQVLPYLIGLSKAGYRFTLVSFEKQERFDTGKQIIEDICKQNSISWHPLPYTKSPPILSTLKDLRAMKKLIRDLHTADPFLLVHCRSYITALVGLWMKKTWAVKMIFDMRGFWANERIDGGIWNLQNPAFKIVYQYFKKKEKQFLINADYTISLTENAKTETESWDIRKNFAPIAVIPCCVDLQLFDPGKIAAADTERLKEELQLQPNQKVMTYIGSIGTWYMLDEMIDFFKIFREENQEAVFLFITKDRKEDIEMAFSRKNIPQNFLRIVAVERLRMPLFIAVADYAIFFIKPAYSKKASSPTKQGEIMAMGIPAICNDSVGDTSAVVDKYHSGVVVKGFSEEAYKKAIRQLLNVNFNKQTIRQGAADFYSLENGIKKYSSVYENILV